MVAGFRRTVSLPGSGGGTSPPEKPHHVRSTSLPCRSHPLISQLEDEVRATRAWQSSPGLRSSQIRLELLHLALDDLLRLPQTQDALRHTCLAEELLDGFLRFADAYGSFRAALVSLQDLQSAAQVAVRRGDAARLASASRSLKKAGKEVAHLASALRDAPRSAEPAFAAAAPHESSAKGVELAGILREVAAVTASVSEAVFHGTSAALSSAMVALAPPKPSSPWTVLRRMVARTSPPPPCSAKKMREEWVRTALERMEGLESCVVGLEEGSERVFRVLINTRVSLLNILTP